MQKVKCKSCLELISIESTYCEYCGIKVAHIEETTRLDSYIHLPIRKELYTLSGIATQTFAFPNSEEKLVYTTIDGIEHVIINGIAYRRVS